MAVVGYLAFSYCNVRMTYTEIVAVILNTMYSRYLPVVVSVLVFLSFFPCLSLALSLFGMYIVCPISVLKDDSSLAVVCRLDLDF